MNSKKEAIEAIKKKLKGQKLTDHEIFALMDEIGHNRLGPILTTYFAAAGFSQGFTKHELVEFTDAMVKTGKQIKFEGIVADKHSIGGVAGTRTSMIVTPIVAAAGFKIPKSSTRAITAAAGTADTMEVLAPVEFPVDQIKNIVNQTNGCIVWGGKLGIAPADDVIIQVERPLAFESFDKIAVSVMAKKIAMGSTHLVIDIPFGPYMKVRHMKDAQVVTEKFEYIAKKFGIKIKIEVIPTDESNGFGVGPVLEIHDVLAILEQDKDRPIKFEDRSLRLAGSLLDMCLADVVDRNSLPVVSQSGTGREIAEEVLKSGAALLKMREIVKAQGGDPNFSRSMFKVGKYKFELKASTSGVVKAINSKELNGVSRILGSPEDKQAGMKIVKRLSDKVNKNDILAVLYSSSKWRLDEAVDTLMQLPMYYLEK
ncbi:thymidine phosphorylase [Candidatus Roizmanbacteria bacterium CG22_combo_CG10-13_8_21_14_all_38_20]|uniref:Thymidine phosphorylase n=1 Tax=Candidatus Roizmanbacteria bacterium CG22_combo_CG10-13_8_21_14_all_38_20 TaxID=1974862 RepID=A0A2H0BWQ2_9BACT|nr:thymidine phosphorylase [Candidatus Microgenomates bacterium]PIP61979.1 MAG: thymidine phosphorylase [Candidatus Roizmanbacteria bacterium CG22_combo_CG10-13_8_21_14_all_38_20]PJC31917.1 MAG: thymidine phosphorylase [Candidatus Roizmanbacteria bacterium CG_4_9_14_0_2_um_filter_38_17]